MKPTTNVYIDGFNLYNGLVRRAEQKGVPTKYRWLNLLRLAELLLPESELQNIFYFTSAVKLRPHDPQQSERQEVFLRALRTLPRLHIQKGKFSKEKNRLPLADDPATLVRVIVVKEKGSDVNLATSLLRDAYEGGCQRAAVISDDSDLVMPIGLANAKLPFGVFVFNRNVCDTGRELAKNATHGEWIAEDAFRRAQLPDMLSDTKGKPLRRPSSW